MTGVYHWLRTRFFPPIPDALRDDVALLRANRIETLTPIGKSYWGTGHTACISDFYQSLRDNRRFRLNLETMEPSIRLMLGTYESARSGHSVTLIEQ